MKKIVSLFLCLLFVLSLLAACKPADNATEGDTSQNSVETAAPIVSLDISKYKIVRAEKMSASLISEVAQFKKTLDALTGKQLGLSDDWLKPGEQPDDNAYEILIGNTNRSQTKEALSKIKGAAYTVSIIGNKIVIVGTTDTATYDALRYFIDTYVTPSPDGMLSIPENLSYISEPYGMIELVTAGTSKYSIIYSDNLDNTSGTNENDRLDYEVQLSIDLKKTIKNLTGADLSISTDWKKPGEDTSDKFEILIGSTNRPETAEALSKIGAADYCIDIIGYKVVVAGWNEVTTKLAVEAFESLVKASVTVNDDGKKNLVLLDNDRLKKTNKEWTTDFPQFEGGVFAGSYDCNMGELGYYYTGTNLTEFNAYRSKLEAAGYTLYHENSLASNHYATYTKGDHFVHTYYVDYQKAVRIISGGNSGIISLPTVYNPNTTEKSVEIIAEPSITQMTLDYASANFGMCYIITLSDGSFIIYDSGGDKGSKDHIRLYNLLNKLNKRTDGKIVIAAWIITHEHWDHFIGFYNFAKAYGNKVTIEQFIANTPSKIAGYNSYNPNTYIEDGKFKEASLFVGNQIKFVKPHSGQVLKIRDAQIEVLFTQEDIYPERLHYFNDSSMITRLTLAGQTVMFLGDTDAAASNIICNMYGSSLKSDIVQIAHHGYRGATQKFYDLINPGFAFWPTSEAEFQKQTTGSGQSYHVVDQYIARKIGMKDIVVASPDNIMIMLPYVFGSEEIIKIDVPVS